MKNSEDKNTALKLNFKDLIAQTKQACEMIKAEIQSLDEKISAKVKERSVIIEAPISKEDYLYFIEQEIQQSANKFKVGLARNLKGIPRALPGLIRNKEHGTTRDYVYIPNEDGMFFFYCGGLILEGISKVLDESFDWPDNAMPYTERMVIVEKLDSEIDELNSQRDDFAEQLSAAIDNK